MRKPALFAIFLLAWALAATAQQHMTFDVAAVTPVGSDSPQVVAGLRVDGAQLHAVRLSLRDYIRIAYKLKEYQVSGPDWMNGARFNIDATLPAGSRTSDIPAMLQSLLLERFQLASHTATKELPVYKLSLASGGLKIKPDAANPNGDLDPNLGPINANAQGSASGTTVSYGNGSSFSLSADHFTVTKMTMGNIADALGRYEDLPVINATGVGGIYDLSLAITPEDYRVMIIRIAVAQGVPLPPQAMALLDGARTPTLDASLAAAGLKISTSRAPLELLVIDHVNRTPIEK
ncbi:MAG TPA: TIGR03435 family protein [Terriglobales bacterium]|nr:TIGR03435 family protein [Terriglobales bacterium]